MQLLFKNKVATENAQRRARLNSVDNNDAIVTVFFDRLWPAGAETPSKESPGQRVGRILDDRNHQLACFVTMARLLLPCFIVAM